MAGVQQVVDDEVDEPPVWLVAEKLAKKGVHNDTGQRECHERERDNDEHERRARLLLGRLLGGGAQLLRELDVVDDHRVAEEHDCERNEVVDDRVHCLPLGKYVAGIVLALVAHDRFLVVAQAGRRATTTTCCCC